MCTMGDSEYGCGDSLEKTRLDANLVTDDGLHVATEQRNDCTIGQRR